MTYKNNLDEKDSEMPRAYFNRGYALILMYLRNHPNVDIPEDMIATDGFPLGQWLKEIRMLLRQNRLDEKRKTMLEALGISYDAEKQIWDMMYLKVLNYYVMNGNLNMSLSYCDEEGALIGAWLDRQKRYYVILEEYQKEKLQEIGLKGM